MITTRSQASIRRASPVLALTLLLFVGALTACGGPPRPPGAGHLVPSPGHLKP